MLFVPNSVYCYNSILINCTRESCLMLWNYNAAAAAGGYSISVCLLKCFLPEVESRTQGSRPRTKQNPRSRPINDFPRTDPLETKDRNAQGHNAQVFSKEKKVFAQKVANFSWNFSRGKKCSWSWPIFSKSKNSAVLGQGQGIFEDLEASRSRTSASSFIYTVAL